MPTYAQLNQEAAWRNEHMPEPMKWFCRELATALGVPQANVGAKGDNAPGHMRGGHRSQRWILTSKYCTNRTYTVWPGLPEHLLDALGAIDVTPKTRQQLLDLCNNLERAMKAGLIEEVVAYYGNTNNDQRVDGWDNIRNAIATSDASHLWHLHITFNRWFVATWSVFQRLLAILLGRPVGQVVVSSQEDFAMIKVVAVPRADQVHFLGLIAGGRPVPIGNNTDLERWRALARAALQPTDLSIPADLYDAAFPAVSVPSIPGGEQLAQVVAAAVDSRIPAIAERAAQTAGAKLSAPPASG